MEVDRLSPRLWQHAKGDDTLALDWDIDSTSVVWEIGGFEGRWAAQMAEKFNPHIFIWEPQNWAYHKLRDRFSSNEKVTIAPVGLWTYDASLTLQEFETDGASVVRQDGRVQAVCQFRDIFTTLQEIQTVDVCLMNIEGGEYVLLPYLIGLDQMRRFRYFWCQFHHGLVEHAEEKTKLIYRGLERTHTVLWDYYPTAVAWERK